MPALSFLSPAAVQPHLPWLIYLPGMDGTGALFHTQSPALSSEFNLRCLCLPSEMFWDWESLCQQFRALLQAELSSSDPQPVILCGESFGGCLALKLAISAPDLFAGMVLINPASSIKHRPWLAWGGPLLPWLPDSLYRASAATFLPWLAALDRIHLGDRRRLLQAMQSVTQSTSAWRLELLRQFDLPLTTLESLTLPILLIASAQDRLLPSVRETASLHQRLPQSRQVILPHSGHACLLEQEVNLYRMITADYFLERCLETVMV
jgi:pimeloyl-ACP methyl ester carboxylesterase